MGPDHVPSSRHGSSFAQLHCWVHAFGEGTDLRTLQKKDDLVSRALSDPEVEASQEFRLSCDQRKSIRYVRLSEMRI